MPFMEVFTLVVNRNWTMSDYLLPGKGTIAVSGVFGQENLCCIFTVFSDIEMLR